MLKYVSRKDVLEILSKKGSDLKYLDDIYKDDKELVLIAVKNDGLALEFASSRLRADKDVYMTAIENNGWAALFISDQNCIFTKDVMLKALKKNDSEWDEIKLQLGLDETV